MRLYSRCSVDFLWPQLAYLYPSTNQLRLIRVGYNATPLKARFQEEFCVQDDPIIMRPGNSSGPTQKIKTSKVLMASTIRATFLLPRS